MKKSMTALLVFSIITINATFAGNIDNNVTKQVLTAFEYEFVQAKEVKWEKGADYFIANFSLNGQVLFAYYTAKGEMMGVGRNISSSQLPMLLHAGIQKNYAEYWISDLFEVALRGESGYYVTLENANQTLILKSNNLKDWSTFKKSKKSE